MNDYIERLKREQRHLLCGAEPEEKPFGLGTVRFIANCRSNSWDVLSRAKTVLARVDELGIAEAPATVDWRNALPEWFTSACAADQTQEEAESWLQSWRALTPEEQVRVEEYKPWSLAGWLHWFKPDNRKWFWWDATEDSADVLIVAVEVEEWPFPWGSLRWLLRASGASRVNSEE